MDTRLRNIGIIFLGWMLAAFAGGCIPLPDSSDADDGNVGVNPVNHPHRRIRGEPNDTFDQPVSIVLDAQNRGRLRGTIRTINDVDVYALEGLDAGDRLIIDAATPFSSLDIALAVFDEAGELTLENDDRDTALNQLDPYIDQILRWPSRIWFIVVAQSPLATQFQTGAYTVNLTVVRSGEVPPPIGQTVVLDFDGGTVVFSPTEQYTVGPFRAADISWAYAGWTAELQRMIADKVRQRYQGFNLDLRVIPQDPLPSDGNYSVILFGGRRSDAFGLAQKIDAYNADPRDQAIIFTDQFRPSQFGRTLTIDELATAIGNVAAHELGHLLGLHHTVNPHDVMDTSGGVLTLIVDQFFTTSPLDASVFPIGWQNGLRLLLVTLGLAEP